MLSRLDSQVASKGSVKTERDRKNLLQYVSAQQYVFILYTPIVSEMQMRRGKWLYPSKATRRLFAPMLFTSAKNASAFPGPVVNLKLLFEAICPTFTTRQ